MVDADYYKDLLRKVFRGKKVIIAVDVLVGAGGQATLLAELGAEPVLAIAGTHGTGTTPEIEYVLLGTDGAPLMIENIRGFERALQDLPDEALAAMDRVDPKREAIVLGSFFTPPGGLGRRRMYGGRPEQWNVIEDKIVIDGFFDDAGITREPSKVIPATELHETGIVAAGDAKEGFNGGGEYVRWIRTDEELAEARAFYAKRCDWVRVMPFLEGIPCSIHGAVVNGQTLALRPVEMLTLRRPTSRFCYAGCATYWDPPDEDRSYMRDVARKVGTALRDRYNYRGAFTVDGVVTEEGFRPTEVNPRAGAGTGPITGASGVPFGLLNKVLIEDEPFDYHPAELEELIVTTGDAKRAGGAYVSLPGEPYEQQSHEIGNGTLVLGASGIGRFVLYAPDPATVTVGASFAPRAVEAFRYADEHFDTAIGPLEPAKSAR